MTPEIKYSDDFKLYVSLNQRLFFFQHWIYVGRGRQNIYDQKKDSLPSLAQFISQSPLLTPVVVFLTGVVLFLRSV